MLNKSPVGLWEKQINNKLKKENLDNNTATNTLTAIKRKRNNKKEIEKTKSDICRPYKFSRFRKQKQQNINLKKKTKKNILKP